jgi:predicted DNA-binding transcriptional regulator YafY
LVSIVVILKKRGPSVFWSFEVEKMSLNKNALIRYKTLDACLQNRFRKWTLEDLVDACSDALYDYEGMDKGVSVRTVQLDIQMMRSEKLGYNAPIIVTDKKYYTYEDPKYSITNIPLTSQDLSTLHEVVTILKQFKGFTHFQEVDGMVGRLEHKIFVGKNAQSTIIDFEKNEQLVGLQYLTPLYESIAQKRALSIDYQSFKAHESQQFEYHPQLLKEYRNRWFVLGFRANMNEPQMLALDRIKALEKAPNVVYKEGNIDATFFDDLIGVTKNLGMSPMKIIFFANKKSTPYITTKPLHPSQELVEEKEEGSVFSLNVIWNFELERELLGFGETIEVISPQRLREGIKRRLQKALNGYLET